MNRPLTRAAAVLTALIALTALAAGQAAAAPPGQVPDGWTLGFDTSPVAGVPVQLHVTGNALQGPAISPSGDKDPAVAAAVLPAGAPCPPSYAGVVGSVFARSWRWTAGSPAASPFTAADVVTFPGPGSYTVCGYYGLEGELSIAANAPATLLRYPPVQVTVARPTVKLAAALSGTLSPGRAATLIGQGASDAPENASFALNLSSTPCAQAAAINDPADQLQTGPDSVAVFGGPTEFRRPVTLPASAGIYHLCGYVAATGREGDPDLVWDSAAAGPDGLIAVLPPGARVIAGTSPPVIYGDGRNGTRKAICTVASRTVHRKHRLLITCTHLTGRVRLVLHDPTGKRADRSMSLKLSAASRVAPLISAAPGRWQATIIWGAIRTFAERIVVAR